MDTAGRLLRLLGLLQTARDWRAEDLADRLEVTERTVRRDVTRLRDLGYPVEAMSGPGGGYRLGAGGRMPPLLLDDDEALAVAVSLRVASSGTVGGLEESALSALSKLEPMLPPRVRGRLEDVSSTTVRLAGFEPPSVDPATLAALAGAARAQERVRFHYIAANGVHSERLCEPFRLVFAHGRWYLVAFDCGREAWRTFRLDRISDVVETLVRFRRENPPDAAAMVADGVAIGAYTHRAEIIVEAPVTEVARIIPPTVGRLAPLDADRCTLVIGGDGLEWVAGYIAGLPFPFEVVSPPELVTVVHRLGRRFIDRHPLG